MSGADITITGKDGSFGGYLASPGSGRGPGIVVIQEIFGVNKVMRDIADGLARRLAAVMARRADFAEGVRAVLVDKDQAPSWSPPTLEALDVERDARPLLDAVKRP